MAYHNYQIDMKYFKKYFDLTWKAPQGIIIETSQHFLSKEIGGMIEASYLTLDDIERPSFSNNEKWWLNDFIWLFHWLAKPILRRKKAWPNATSVSTTSIALIKVIWNHNLHLNSYCVWFWSLNDQVVLWFRKTFYFTLYKLLIIHYFPY